MTENTETKKKSRSLLILLAAFCLILAILLIFTYTRMRVFVKDKESEKTELRKELDSLLTEHNKIKVTYGALTDSLTAKDSLIQSQAVQIKKLLDTEWQYFKVQKRIALLQKIAQDYVHRIDSLYTVNSNLKEENMRIQEDFRSERDRNSELSKDKEVLTEKVTKAAVLKAYNVTGTGIRYKGGQLKEQVTDKANRVEKVKICFTLGENPLVEPGKRTLYIRIARPDKVVITKSKYDTFKYNGDDIPFSIDLEADYQNKSMDLCGYWIKKDNKEAAMVGRYAITVYSSGTLIGEGSFDLK